MNEPDEVLLIGGGGHCTSCIDVIESTGKWRIGGIVERAGADRGSVMGYPVIGEDADLPALRRRYAHALVTIGQIESAAARVAVAGVLRELGFSLPVVVSGLARVSRTARVAPGTVVMHGAVVNALAEIGENCIINTHAVVEHEAVIGTHCHVSTGAVINGGCRVGERCFIGSGAVLMNGISVSAGCVVGAGSLVTADLTESGTYWGSPARKHR